MVDGKWYIFRIIWDMIALWCYCILSGLELRKKYYFMKNIFIIICNVKPIQDGPFWGCSWMRVLKSPLSKICQIYHAMIKLGTVTPYVKKIQKIHKSCDTPLELCCYQHFLLNISNFCYIKKYRYRLHFKT